MKKNRIILLLAVVLWLTSSVSAATIDRIAVRSEAMKKEIQKDPQKKQMASMLNYINDISAVAMACLVTVSN